MKSYKEGVINLFKEEKDMMKKEVARMIGVVESVYCELENNKLNISTKRLYQLGEFFEVNII